MGLSGVRIVAERAEVVVKRVDRMRMPYMNERILYRRAAALYQTSK